MEDSTQRSPLTQLRDQFRAPAQAGHASDELLSEPNDVAGSPSRRKKLNTGDQFTGPMTATQMRLPADLIASLRLHSINTGETMSAIVLRCLTTPDVLEKAWISTRKAS